MTFRDPAIVRVLVWSLIAAPLAVVTYDYVYGETYYGGYIHQTGRWAIWLMMAALAVTPLRLTFPSSATTRWLVQQRRYFGVAAFFYALAHMIAYLLRVEKDRLIEDLATFGMWSGWLALAIFAALAMTSNNWSVRRLWHSWKPLHRLVYVAALLSFLHWVLIAFDPFLAWCHIVALALLEIYRVAMARRTLQ